MTFFEQKQFRDTRKSPG